jgi:hypothetical protein
MGVETALLFCAIRASETLGTLPFAHDTRAGYEIALCMKRDGGVSILCLTEPAIVLEFTGHPRRFGSVAACYTGAFVKETPHKVRKKYQVRFQPADQ